MCPLCPPYGTGHWVTKFHCLHSRCWTCKDIEQHCLTTTQCSRDATRGHHWAVEFFPTESILFMVLMPIFHRSPTTSHCHHPRIFLFYLFLLRRSLCVIYWRLGHRIAKMARIVCVITKLKSSFSCWVRWVGFNDGSGWRFLLSMDIFQLKLLVSSQDN